MEINEEFFEKLVSIVGGGIVFADSEANIVFVNTTFSKMLGYTQEDLKEMTVMSIVDPDCLHLTKKVIEQGSQEPGFEVQIEETYLKKNKEKLYGLTTVRSHEFNGEIYFSAFINDFVDQRIARQREQSHYENIVELADDIIFSVDIDGKFLYVNQNAKDLTGFSEEELLTFSYLDMVFPSHKGEVGMFFHDHFKSRKNKVQFTFPIQTKTGKLLWLDQKLNTNWSEDKQVILGYSAVARNVTKEWETSQRLAESESHYQALFDNSPIPKKMEDFSQVKKYITKLKSLGITNFLKYFSQHPEEVRKCVSLVKVIESNTQVQVLHGAESKEELSQNIAQVFTDESYETFKEELVAIANGETLFETKSVVKTIKGERKHIQLKWMVMPGCEESLEKVMITTVDITELLVGRQALLDSQKHYKALFEDSTIPLRLEDFGAIDLYFDKLRKEGIENLLQYFSNNQAALSEVSSLVKITEINTSYLSLFGVGHQQELLLDPARFVTPKAVHDFIDDLNDLYQGVKEKELETEVRDINGNIVILAKKWVSLDQRKDKVGRLFVSSVDITSRKLAEYKILESERNYQALFNDSPVPLWLEDLSEVMQIVDDLRSEGVNDFQKYFDDHMHEVIALTQKVKVLQVNQQVLTLHDAKSQAELLGNFHKIFTVNALEAFKGELIKLINKEPSAGVDCAMRTINGEEVVVRMQWSVMAGHEDRCDKVFVSSLDITQQSIASQELKNNERRLTTVFENIGIPILMSDPKSARIVEVNDVAIEALGYTRQALLEMNIADLDTKHTKDYVVNALNRCYEEGVVEGVSQWATKTGKVRDIFIKNSLINLGGEDRILSACNDITELNNLNIENERFRVVMDNAPFAIYITDFETGKFVDVNHTATEQLGYSREELLALSSTDLEQTDILQDDEERRKHFEGMASNPESIVAEGIHKRKDGSLFPVKVTVNVRVINDVRYMIASVFDDTVANEKTRKIEEQNQVLKIIQSLQSEFISGADLRRQFVGFLDSLILYTKSAFGFIGEIEKDNGVPYLKTHAITDISWSDETRNLYQEMNKSGFEFRNLDTLFGVTISTGEVVISNDPKNDPRSGGIPKGHPPLKCYIGIPIIANNELIGMVGLANRADGYVEDLIDELKPFISTYSVMIQALQTQEDRARTQKKLEQVNKALSEEIQFRKVVQRHSLDAEEKERKRTARDLHDGLGQRLTAIKLSLGAIKKSNKLQGHLKEVLADSIEMVNGSMGEVRAISQDILPVVLSDFGLSEGLDKVCHQTTEASGVEVSFNLVGEIVPLEDFVKTSLYRIAQEAINNAIKYANSKKVKVELKFSSTKGFVQLNIDDFGQGFDPQKIKKGMGLNNIKDRGDMINAKVEVKSKLNIGTTISVKYLF